MNKVKQTIKNIEECKKSLNMDVFEQAIALREKGKKMGLNFDIAQKMGEPQIHHSKFTYNCQVPRDHKLSF